MKLEQRYNLDQVRNRSADLVVARVEQLLEEEQDMCRCEQCVLDLVAYALNHVSPQYGTSLLEPLAPNPDMVRKIQIEVEMAIELGLRRVRARPGH
jgi:competence protein ComFB